MIKKQLIEKIFKPIEASKGKVYFVGGCVRDELLGKQPHDFDIVTDLTPEKLHKVFTKFSNVSKNSEKFGVTMVLVDIDGKLEEIEIATFRKDETKGRHPEVSLKATIEEDAARRDFTVNALYEDSKGNILDPTGQGRFDIASRTLRFVGDAEERLSEDPLRAFRFVRFLAQKGFQNPYAFETLSYLGKIIDFKGVSKERKLKEIKQIFAGKYFTSDSPAYLAGVFLGVLKDIGLIDIFMDMDKIIQSIRWHAEGSKIVKNGVTTIVMHQINFANAEFIEHGTVLAHTFLTWKEMHNIIFEGKGLPEIDVDYSDPEKRFLLILSAMLHDIGKSHCEHQGEKVNAFEVNGLPYSEIVPKVADHPKTGIPYAEAFCKNLGMSNDEVSFVCSMVEHHMDAHELSKRTSKKEVWEFCTLPHFKEIMLVALADERGSIKLEGFDERGSVPDTLKSEYVAACMNKPMPVPILTGEDLIAFGRKPGPIFRKILDTALKFQIDQNVTDKKILYRSVKNVELSKKEKGEKSE